MDIIKKGIGITKTIRNVNRLREIVSVFARHGFDEFISKNIVSIIPDFALPKSKRSVIEEAEQREDKDLSGVIGHRLRLCFEELGPAFVKLGQLLAGREDIFDKSFIQEMRLLQDKVKPVPYSEIKNEIEETLGKKVDEVFKSIDENPIGTASIGVVHKAQLIDGTDVVVKVRRPNISKEVKTDLSLLKYIAYQVERVSDDIKFLGISRIIHDFSVTINIELNFNIEALNCKRIKTNVLKHDTNGIFHIPQVYEEFTRENLLVAEYLDGVAFSDSQNIKPHIEEITPKLLEGIEIFIKTLLNDGFFHADLHGGNFFYLKNGKIGLVDFGLMGNLSKKARMNFIALIYSILNYNYENIVYEFLDVAEFENIPDIDKLENSVREALSPYIGLTVQQADFTLILNSVLRTLKQYELFIPREWYIVFRALITIDGVGRSLGIDLDLYSVMNDNLDKILKDTFKKEDIMEEALWSGRDIATSIRTVPRHLKWFIKEWSKKSYAFEIIHKGHEKSVDKINNSIQFLGYIFSACVFFVAGVSLLKGKITHISDLSKLSLIFWIISIFFFYKSYRRSRT